MQKPYCQTLELQTLRKSAKEPRISYAGDKERSLPSALTQS
ncbi:MAG: hypothetical protein VKL42_03680 [Snowella sp.]|nr:hypothetical protein [Snowella sp.]